MNAPKDKSGYTPENKSGKTVLPMGVPAFAPVLDEAIDSIENLPAPLSVSRHTPLIKQGQQPEFVYLLTHGLVKLVYLSPSGQELTLGLRSKGWYAGGSFLVLKTPSVYSVETITKCMVIRLPARDFQRQLSENSKFRDHFLTALCLEVSSQAGTQAQVMSGTAEDRLAYFMQEREFPQLQWQTLDPLPLLKQMELAQLLAITPEHLSRLLHKRKSEKKPPPE